jgi:predicted Zn finger-like uncharacterized protein
MSLITRCSSCGTMFKVVADQLKISHGWVRCGHCQEVFDAAANLQPRLSPETLQDGHGDGRGPETLLPDIVELPPEELPPAQLQLPSHLSVAIEADERSVVDMDEQTAPASLPGPQVSLPADLSAELLAASVGPEPPAYADSVSFALGSSRKFQDSDLPESEPVGDVSFVREARQHAFWRQSSVRALLSLVSLVFVMALLLQIAIFQRNVLAVQQPWLEPGLQTLCKHLKCEIKPPQKIESVVIESSSFGRIGPDTYRLKVVIKNVGAILLSMPSLELTLTDTQEQALLRRVLTPGELGFSGDALNAGAGFAGELTLKISTFGAVPHAASLQPSGYRILAFYP